MAIQTFSRAAGNTPGRGHCRSKPEAHDARSQGRPWSPVLGRAAAADEIVGRLPGGYETPLGRWFDNGAELSRGEWQRIALARAFFRNSPIILLDEPTGAMDSWAESDWLERFHRLAAGRIAVVITHRLTTATRADVIHVMHDGRIVESGRHEELLARGGRYAESWALQVEV